MGFFNDLFLFMTMYFWFCWRWTKQVIAVRGCPRLLLLCSSVLWWSSDLNPTDKDEVKVMNQRLNMFLVVDFPTEEN